MRSLRTAILIVCSFLAFWECQSVQANPVQWTSASGGNDHYYDFIQVPNPYVGNNNAWAAVSAIASTSVYNGLNGYLATVTSQGENNFLMSLVPAGLGQGAGAWLGGKSPEGWLTGPESGQAFGYTNFGGVEPNNAGLVYMIVGSTFANVNPGQWADDSGVQGLPDPVGDRVIGYFVEYSGPVSTPEPASLAAFGGLALAGLVGYRRRKHAAA